MLALRGPGDQVGAEEDTKNGRGFPGFRAAYPIGIKVGDKLMGWRLVELKPKVGCALYSTRSI